MPVRLRESVSQPTAARRRRRAAGAPAARWRGPDRRRASALRGAEGVARRGRARAQPAGLRHLPRRDAGRDRRARAARRCATCKASAASARRSSRPTASEVLRVVARHASVHEADVARLAHFGLDAVLGFELLEELFRRELRGQDVAPAASPRRSRPGTAGRACARRGLRCGRSARRHRRPALRSRTSSRAATAVSGLNRILNVKRRSAAWSMRSIRLVVHTKMPLKRSMPCSISLTSVTS